MDRKGDNLLRKKRTLRERMLQGIPFYQRKFQSKMSVLSFKTNCYKSHQGEREKARGMRQIAQGIISKDQLYGGSL